MRRFHLFLNITRIYLLKNKILLFDFEKKNIDPLDFIGAIVLKKKKNEVV